MIINSNRGGEDMRTLYKRFTPGARQLGRNCHQHQRILKGKLHTGSRSSSSVINTQRIHINWIAGDCKKCSMYIRPTAAQTQHFDGGKMETQLAELCDDLGFYRSDHSTLQICQLVVSTCRKFMPHSVRNNWIIEKINFIGHLFSRPRRLCVDTIQKQFKGSKVLAKMLFIKKKLELRLVQISRDLRKRHRICA